MDLHYDENILSNPFFQQLQLDHAILLETSPLENWKICVPRKNCIKDFTILHDPEYLLAHILVSHPELPETQFSNLIGKTVKLFDKKLYVSESSSSGWGETEVNILFEEIFYTKDFLKYKIWCIDEPLITKKQEEFQMKSDENTINLYIINNLRDAMNLIWNETKSKTIFRKIETSINNFMRTKLKRTGEYNLEILKKNTNALFNQCLDIVKTIRPLNKKCKQEPYFLSNVKIAVETYMMNLLYPFIFDAITTTSLTEIQTFNKIIKKLSDLHLSHFQIDPEFNSLIPIIKMELGKIDDYTTALDKLACLKRTMNVVTLYQNKQGETANSRNLSIDDFLPILVFSIIKSGGTHWITNLIFLKEFIFTDIRNNSDIGAESFLIATLEAALTFIQSGNIKQLEKNSDDKIKNSIKLEEDSLEYLFSKIIEDNENDVMKYFQKQTEHNKSGTTILCHPLCDCCSCKTKLIQQTNKPNINVKDSNGISALHIAAMYGLPKILNLLISMDGDVNIRDDNNWTPLHYTASRGHQNTLLLLLHAGSDINAENFEKNTPLHLCSHNGHENCVKGILYFAEHMRIKVNINAQNNTGNTPLHYSAKWGFIEIVETLLEYNADAYIANNTEHISIDYAHNSKIKHILQNGFHLINGNWGDCLIEQTKINSNLDDINKIDKIINAISVGDTNLALFYLELNREIITNPVEQQLHHPLCICYACRSRHPTAVSSSSLILNSSDKFDINTSNNLGLTALHAASFYGNTDLILILIQNKADIKKKSNQGQTLLHLCCQNGKVKQCKIILDLIKNHEEIINLKDNYGNTILHYAVKLGNKQLVETLLNYKPDLTIKNNDNKRPIDIAKYFLFMNIIDLLEGNQ